MLVFPLIGIFSQPPIIETKENQMFTSRFLTRVATLLTILMMALSSVQPAYAAAPSNDNFAAATPINTLPFTIDASNFEATLEAGEPDPTCGFGYPLKTIWYSYTPSADATLTVLVNYPTIVSVYTGSSVDSLNPVGCAPYYYGQLSFAAQATVTYYFQLSDIFGNEGTFPFTLEVAPPPQVGISYGPSDASIFDNVGFSAYVNDPAGIYGDTYAWTISDGTTSDQGSFSHQFAADGDYSVNLTFTTFDGRSNSANVVVQVRTRDVAINKLVVPQTARVNQTKAINVDVTNKRYSDYVQVSLYKGLPGGGEQLIGTLTIYVPARATRPTTFKFSYTFTAADATVGKVTFRAEATIMGARDALPADNNAIATTLVTK
jgi:hypothetical protein